MDSDAYDAFESKEIRVVGLDLEQTSYFRDGAFPLPHDPLISAAIVTWDGRKLCRYTCGYHDDSISNFDNVEVCKVADSQELVKWILEWILEERPDFVVIHNGYNFDIPRMAVHSPPIYEDLFVNINLGKKSRGMDLVIPGVSILDTYHYIDKLHRSDYSGLSLDTLSNELGVGSKASQPDVNIDIRENVNMSEMILYNIWDSYLHLAVAVKGKCISEIATMCAVFKSPISDTSRYITGTMISNLMTSFAIRHRVNLDHSPEESLDRSYEGAMVLKPKRGYHTRVEVLDISSMYPSIMIGGNISFETVLELQKVGLYQESYQNLVIPEGLSKGSVWWDKENLLVTSYNNDRFVINLSPESISSLLLKELIETRARIGKKSELGWALKVGANSLYGALGAKTSPLRCYGGAFSITQVGRWLTNLMGCIAIKVNLKVLYGDTDSIFVKSSNHHSKVIDAFLTIIHRILDFTPFSTMRLEKDVTYNHLILVEPKLYYGVTDNKVVAKGLSVVRKDRIELAKRYVSMVCQIICNTPEERVLERLMHLSLKIIDTVVNKPLNLVECSLEKKRGGISFLEYQGESGKFISARKDRASEITEKPSRRWVYKMVVPQVDSILSVCSFYSVEQLSKAAVT